VATLNPSAGGKWALLAGAAALLAAIFYMVGKGEGSVVWPGSDPIFFGANAFWGSLALVSFPSSDFGTGIQGVFSILTLRERLDAVSMPHVF